MEQQFIQYLEGFVNENRIHLLNKILESRTKYLTVVLEDIYQPHNANAILRTCDCFGIQDIHVIENRNKYSPNDQIAMGSEQWLSLTKYNHQINNSKQCLQTLKSEGYRLIATTVHKNSISLENFDIYKGKSAIIFGTELTGISHEVEELADEFLTIPTFGFTESLNISVSVALILHYLTLKLFKSEISWKLTQYEKDKLKINWLKNSIKKAELIEKHYYQNLEKNNLK